MYVAFEHTLVSALLAKIGTINLNKVGVYNDKKYILNTLRRSSF